MKNVNVTQILNDSKFTRFHAMLLFWGCYLVLFDGIEVGIFGAIATPLIKEWSLTPVQFGFFSSYASLGMVIGALVSGPLADKFGRKKLIIANVLFYSCFTLLGAFSTGPTDFGVYRFLAGIGMGGVVPTLLGLVTDYSPKAKRSLITATITSFIAVGATIATFIAIFMIPAFGWRSLFIVGGLPIITLPFVIKMLPESPLTLIKKGKFDQLSSALNRLSYGKIFSSEQKYELEIRSKAKVPFTALFQNKNAVGTLLIWLTFFFSYVVTFALSTWLPNLMVKAGYPVGSSLVFSVVLQVGAIIGSLSGGRIGDKSGFKKVIVLSFLIGGVSLMILGVKFSSPFLLYLILFITGLGSIGSQNMLVAFTSQFYPTEIRSTGIGSASIWGRVGSFVGPLITGVLLSMNATTATCFAAFGVFALLAAVLLMGVRDRSAAKNAVNLDADRTLELH